MTRHITNELLSAYLDTELARAEVARVESHCDRCPDCRARLNALRRVAQGVASLGSVSPPAALRSQIRRQVVAAPLPARQIWLSRLRWLFEVPSQPAWRSAAVGLLVVVVGSFLLNQLTLSLQRPVTTAALVRHETVETILGEPPLGTVQTTTGEVDGLKFVWTEGAGWVQQGLEGERPMTSVDVTSPEGRALLRRFNDLQVLLADGDSVVLRYNLETVEIRAGKGSTSLPIGEAPRQRLQATLDPTARVV